MTRYATVQEQDRACAAILVENLRGYVKCEGRRWYVWDEQAWKWERATIVHGVSHRIVREVERLIIQAVREDDFEEACVWRRYLYHGDIGIRLTPQHGTHLPGEPSATPPVEIGLAEWVGRGPYTPTPPIDAPRGSSAIPPLV